MMEHGAYSQNQSIVPKKYQNLFKISQNDKTDTGLKKIKRGSVSSFCGMLNILLSTNY